MALPDRRRVVLAAGIVLVALFGGLAGLLVLGVRHDVGPVTARLTLRPALTGDTRVEVAPLGSISVDSHDGPLRLTVVVTRLRPEAARRALADPASLRGLGHQVAGDLRAAVALLVLRAGVTTVAGAALLGALVFRRRWRPTACAVGVAGGMLAACGGIIALTWRPAALAEPRYSGLLANAPALVGNAQDIARRFDLYSEQLAGIVTDVSRLYDVTRSLPAFTPDKSTVRVLHVSDLHLNPAAWDVIRSISRQYGVAFVVDSGDVTDHGSAPEDHYLGAIRSLGVPYVFVRGNHDSTHTEDVLRRQRGAVVLDGAAQTVAGLRMWGVGDPRYTPDKTTRDDDLGVAALERYGQVQSDRLAAVTPVDIAVTHDPVVARRFGGLAPLILAGHTHVRSEERLDGSLLLIEGSTGGAGLRGLEGERPTPLECSVLYLDAVTHRLVARDDITIGGLGLTSAQVQRHVVRADRPAPSPSQ